MVQPPRATTYTLAQVAEQARRRGDRFDREAAARCVAWESLRERAGAGSTGVFGG